MNQNDFKILLASLGYTASENQLIYTKDNYHIILYSSYYGIRIGDYQYFFSFGTFPLDAEMFESDLRRIQPEIKNKEK